MNKYSKLIAVMAIVPILVLVVASENISFIDASPATGSEGTQSPKSYGSATSDTVCGDKLCKDVSPKAKMPEKITVQETSMPEFMPSLEFVSVSKFSGD